MAAQAKFAQQRLADHDELAAASIARTRQGERDYLSDPVALAGYDDDLVGQASGRRSLSARLARPLYLLLSTSSGVNWPGCRRPLRTSASIPPLATRSGAGPVAEKTTHFSYRINRDIRLSSSNLPSRRSEHQQEGQCDRVVELAVRAAVGLRVLRRRGGLAGRSCRLLRRRRCGTAGALVSDRRSEAARGRPAHFGIGVDGDRPGTLGQLVPRVDAVVPPDIVDQRHRSPSRLLAAL
jgi:hypothetical protein